jgi:hypothetical protein
LERKSSAKKDLKTSLFCEPWVRVVSTFLLLSCLLARGW